MVAGVALMLLAQGFAHILATSLVIFFVIIVNLVLRLTYFKSVPSDLRERRRQGRESG
jgi:hypothetical protein